MENPNVAQGDGQVQKVLKGGKPSSDSREEAVAPQAATQVPQDIAQQHRLISPGSPLALLPCKTPRDCTTSTLYYNLCFCTVVPSPGQNYLYFGGA